MQTFLAQLGFDPGPADGRLGPATRDAIRGFEASRGLRPRGRATRELLARLQAEQAASVAPAGGTASPGNALPDQESPTRAPVLSPDRLLERVGRSIWLVLAARSLADLESGRASARGTAIAIAPDRVATSCLVTRGANIFALVRGEIWREARLASPPGPASAGCELVSEGQAPLSPARIASPTRVLGRREAAYALADTLQPHPTLRQVSVSAPERGATGAMLGLVPALPSDMLGAGVFDIHGELLGLADGSANQSSVSTLLTLAPSAP